MVKRKPKRPLHRYQHLRGLRPIRLTPPLTRCYQVVEFRPKLIPYARCFREFLPNPGIRSRAEQLLTKHLLLPFRPTSKLKIASNFLVPSNYIIALLWEFLVLIRGFYLFLPEMVFCCCVRNYYIQRVCQLV